MAREDCPIRMYRTCHDASVRTSLVYIYILYYKIILYLSIYLYIQLFSYLSIHSSIYTFVIVSLSFFSFFLSSFLSLSLPLYIYTHTHMLQVLFLAGNDGRRSCCFMWRERCQEAEPLTELFGDYLTRCVFSKARPIGQTGLMGFGMIWIRTC